MAALRAAETIKLRMADYLAKLYQSRADSIDFLSGSVILPSGQSLSFSEAKKSMSHGSNIVVFDWILFDT